MRRSIIIGILCVMLALVGFASGDVYEFTDSYGDTYATGQVTFDENGIVNGAVIAGATNGDVNVEQSASQGDGSVSVSQSGEIQGDYGFAGTLAADGNGNSGGNFASVTGGSMAMDQETFGGQISSGGYQSEGQYGFIEPVFTASGLISDQFVEMEGSSGYAGTLVANANGASAQTGASFTNGGMDAIQGGAVGGASLEIPYYQGIFSTSIAIPDFTVEGAVAGQGAYIWGSSGSASTTVSDGNGASGQSLATFSNGGMDLIQAGGAGSVSIEDLYPFTGYEIPAPVVPGSLSLGGAVAGQSVYMGGSSGSASTTVSDGNGASGTTVTSFTNAEIYGLIQAGAAGDVFITSPYYTSAEPIELSMGGVIVGQDLNVVEGASGSATTTVTHENGASAQSTASFTDGKMGTIQAGAAGDASLLLPDYLFGDEIDVSLGVDGVIAGQDFYAKDSGSASALTSARDANGNYALANASVSSGNMYTTQVAGAGDVDLGLAFTSAGSEEEQLGLSASGIFAAQAGKMGGSSGSASTEVEVNGTHSGNYAEFTEGTMDFSQLSAGIT
jgi:hypothetical protein